MEDNLLLHSISKSGIEISDEKPTKKKVPKKQEPEILPEQVSKAAATHLKKMVNDSKNEQEEKKNTERESLMATINAYYNEFKILERLKIDHMSIPELRKELERIQSQLNHNQAFQAINKLDTLLNYGVESFLVSQGVPAMGLTQWSATTEGKEIVMQELREFTVKYGSYFQTGPEIRYTFNFIQRVMGIVEMNKRRMDTPMNTNESKKYDDL